MGHREGKEETDVADLKDEFWKLLLEDVLKVIGCDFRYWVIPPSPLEKGGTGFKVPLFKGDVGGSIPFLYQRRDF